MVVLVHTKVGERYCRKKTAAADKHSIISTIQFCAYNMQCAGGRLQSWKCFAFLLLSFLFIFCLLPRPRSRDTVSSRWSWEAASYWWELHAKAAGLDRQLIYLARCMAAVLHIANSQAIFFLCSMNLELFHRSFNSLHAYKPAVFLESTHLV